MKHILHVLFVCWLFSSPVAQAQKQHHYCGENSFQTELVSMQTLEQGCVKYELKVTTKSLCTYALSHYTVAMSCGRITSATNSENWKQEFGYDRTTGLYGVKIDDIPNFGETSLKSFTVTITVCPSEKGDKCYDNQRCCYPIVAYKAARCVYYERIKESCTNPPPSTQLDAHLEKRDVSCYGLSDGNIDVIVDAGVEPYTYAWSTGDATSSVTNLPAGVYEVIIRDASGAEITLLETIQQPDQIILSATIMSASCGGIENGSIDLEASGGTGEYTYLWSNGATTQDITALSAGVYTVTVTDGMGCSSQATFEVKNIADLGLNATTTMPACNQTNGSITVSVLGGAAPFKYLWSTGATTPGIENLGPGNYSVTVTDAAGCSVSDTYSLKENNTLKLTATVTQTSCQDDGSGAIDLLVEGGTEPYQYSWSDGVDTEDRTGLSAGTYTVTVTDQNGCTTTLRISVTKKTFQVSNQIVQPSCDGQLGSVSLLPVNGVEPYTYLWSTGDTGSAIHDLSPGIYTVVITDATGCTRQLTYVMMEPGNITVNAEVSNNNCNAEGFYSIDLNVTGGQTPYTYQWSNGSTDEDQQNLNAGTYTVVISDAGGCQVTKEVVIPANDGGIACRIEAPSTAIQCGSVDNTLTSTTTNADLYQWSLGSSDGQWIITSGADSPVITFTAGSANSTATATLNITKDGCTQTCSYELAACIPADEEPDPGDGDDTCEDCFDSEITLLKRDGSCRTYEVMVSSGSCRFDLSHWNIAIPPCGKVMDYSNSRQWKMEKGLDPTTGISGLKVDDIENFSDGEKFTVRFTICADDDCEWNPVVAYKAGQCVSYDTLQIGDSDDDDYPEPPSCNVYPNPFKEKLSFEWTAHDDDNVWLDLYDYQGHHVKKLFHGHVQKGQRYKVDCSALDGSMYIYRFKTKRGTVHGKLCKSR